MARTLLVVSLVAATGALFVGCTQDFNVFKPGDGGAGGHSTSSSSVVTSSSQSTGAGGADECTTTDLSKCDDMNVCTTESCVAGKCSHANVANGLKPGYVDNATDCVDDICTNGVLMAGAPDNTEIPDDMNVCTIDTCAAGLPVATPDMSKNGQSCGANSLICDAGTCVGCLVGGDCPGTDTFCQIRTCSAMHVCGLMTQNEGTATPTGQMAGDCKSLNCVAGMATSQDDNDPPAQTAGDCKTQTCVGGVVTPVAANDPPNDNNACTMDTCVNMVSTPVPLTGTPCGTGATCTAGSAKTADACNAGSCVAGTSALCTPYSCAATACNMICTADLMCAAGKHCETAAVPAAYQNTCVQCVNDTQCSAGTTRCAKSGDAAQDTCVECIDNTTCNSPKPTCKLSGAGAYTCMP